MASKHHGATKDYWSFVMWKVTEVTGQVDPSQEKENRGLR
jgi:hypothetical protein